jgi:hypothetical protein
MTRILQLRIVERTVSKLCLSAKATNECSHITSDTRVPFMPSDIIMDELFTHLSPTTENLCATTTC